MGLIRQNPQQNRPESGEYVLFPANMYRQRTQNRVVWDLPNPASRA